MEPSRSGFVRVEGGRRVGWTEWGPPDGAPVLFCTGAGMSGALGFGDPDRRGVRLLCVDRAGLGRSDPDPAKRFPRWTTDVAAALAASGIERPATVGFSQGAPFAIALAAAGLTGPLAIVAGQDELAHPAIRPLLAPEVAAMVAAVETDPAGFEARIAASADADGLVALVLAMSSPHDRAVYERFLDRYRRSVREGFAQGPAGYARDLALALGRWPLAPEAVEVPVTLWYGRRDASPVHSPDLGATLAARFRRATRHVLDDEGGSLLWTRADDVLDELLG